MGDVRGERDLRGRDEGQDPQHTVLEQVSRRLGHQTKITLPDEGSEHAVSPLIDARSPDARALPEGRGNYQVLGEIARGGMGVIMKSHDTDLGRDVAMKILRNEHAGSEAILQRFVEEAQIGGQLQHPGIVPVYELGLMEDQRPYFTMKLVKGRTLAKLLTEREGDTGGRRRFLTIFEKVCETVAYAHARNVLHRDLKPANIMVGAFGEVQVVDWGLAKVLKEGGTSDERAAEAQLTQVSIIETVRSGSSTGGGSESLVGSIMGTPSYMPPEQALGEIEALDERADVFALGAILCEILTGKPPYVGGRDEVIQSASKARLDPARERLEASGADPELIELCLDCMAPAKAARPRDAEALLERVHAWSSGQEQRVQDALIEAAEAAVEARAAVKARRLTLALAAAVLAAGLGGAAFWVRAQDEAANERAAVVRQIDGHLDEAVAARSGGAFASAAAACDRAEAVLAAAVGPDPAFLADIAERIAAVRVATERAADEAGRAQLEADRRRRFLADLQDVLLGEGLDVGLAGPRERRRDDFQAVFEAYGFDPTGGEPDEVAAALTEMGDNQAIAVALDEFARVHRTFGWNGAEARRLTELARRLDPDPVRQRLRDAIEADDRAVFAELAASREALSWPPATVAMVALTQQDMKLGFDMTAMLERCQRANPGDPVLNQVLSGFLQFGKQDPAAALPLLSAALAVRPTNSVVAYRMALALNALDRQEEACAVLANAFVRAPHAEWLLDRGLTEIRKRVPRDTWFRYTLSTYDQVLEARPDLLVQQANAHWYRIVDPDSSRDQLVASTEAIRALIDAGDDSSAYWNSVGCGELRLGRPAEALAAFQASIELSEVSVHPTDALGVAVALYDGGSRETARVWYRQAEALREQQEPSWEEDLIWEMGRERFDR